MRKIRPNVDWRKYFNKYNSTIVEYYKNFGDAFLIQTILKIEKATKQRKPRPFVLIRFKDTDIVSVVEPHEITDVLSSMLDVCIHMEKYELCIDIKNILDKHTDKITNRKVKDLIKQ